jgi:hypothetical protein
MLDGDESDVDCGGSCALCGAFARCYSVQECVDGTTCTDDQSCDIFANPLCGSICAPRCDGAPCAAGQVCTDSSLCFKQAGPGESCSTSLPGGCVTGFYCDPFGFPYVCVPKAKPGGSCSSTEACPAGYHCSVPGGACVTNVTAGGACNAYDACADGLYCDFAEPSGHTVCAPSAGAGMPCHDALGSCQGGLDCVFAPSLACTRSMDCKSSGGACCATAGGAACGPYTAGCTPPDGVCQ